MATANAKVQRLAKTSNELERSLVMSEFGSLRVAQLEGLNAEAARIGRRFAGGNSIIANGIAPVQAIPTTTATLALVNTNPDGGRSLFLDQLGFWLGSGTAAAGATLLVAVSGKKITNANLPVAQPTGYAVGSMSGNGSSLAIWKTALAVDATTVWFQLLSTQQLAAANVGQGDDPQSLAGGLVIPPGYALCIAILSGAGTTPLYGVSALWNEFENTIEV